MPDIAAVEEAVAARRFDVAYEPIVEVATGARCAYEALARFRAPGGAAIPADKVFAWLHRRPELLAETETALKEEQVARAPDAPLFVNLDPDSLACAPDGGRAILAALAGHGARVVVEVVENVALSDAGRIRRMIREVRTAGLGVALDDLGAPNALVSLESLVQVDLLKFDRSVLRSIGDLRYRTLVESMVGMARRIGVRTVLEGVETGADLAVAEALGVELVQGYLFRDAFLTARRRRTRARRGSSVGGAAR